jgi:membrane-associated phospholipid phosphatase
VTAPRWAAFVILFAIAAALAFDLDHMIARQTGTIGPEVLGIFQCITWFGQGAVTLVPSGLALALALWLRPRLPSLSDPLGRVIRSCALIFTTVAIAGLANDGLKLIFSRARPRLWLHGDLSGFFFDRLGSDYQSFPSGHTATSVAAAIVLAGLFPRWRIGFAIFALLIASSRVVLSAHYLSDVLAGAAVGAASAAAVTAWFRRRGWYPSWSRAAIYDRVPDR